MTEYGAPANSSDPDPSKDLDNYNWAEDSQYKEDYLSTCPDGNPFITWAGRQWWINYWWSPATGTWTGDGNYNSNFDPRQFFIPDPVHDELTLRTFGNEVSKCITAEIVLGDLLGYGDYVVTVKANMRPFAQFDDNVCLGVFTYQWGTNNDPPEYNTHREIDMVETLSYNSQTRGDPNTNAQFTLQPANKSDVINRFTIPKDCDTITLWLKRKAPEVRSPDTILSAFNGSYSLAQLQTDPKVPTAFHDWVPSTVTGGKDYLPHHTPESRERLHINLYLTPVYRSGYERPAGYPPQHGEHSVTLTRFEFAQSRVWQGSVPINQTQISPGTTPSYLSFVDANWFYLICRGADNKLMWFTKEFGFDWSNGEYLNESDPGLVTKLSPAAVTWPVSGPEPSLLYVFFVSPNPGNPIWYTMFDGQKWAQGQPIATKDSTPTGPAATYFNNKLYLFFAANDSHRIIYRYFDGKDWNGGYINDAMDRTSAAPAVVQFNGELYIFFKGDGNNQLAMCKPAPDGRWYTCQVLNDINGPITTFTAPAAIVLDGKLCVFYTPDPGGLMKYCVGTPDQKVWVSQVLNAVDKPGATPVAWAPGTGDGDAFVWFTGQEHQAPQVRLIVGSPG